MLKIVIFVLTLTFGQLMAQGNYSPIDETKVPENIMKHFKGIHQNATSVHWGMRYRGKRKIYKAKGVDGGHHFSLKMLDDGTELGRIYAVNANEISEKVIAEINATVKEGWTMTHAYHHYKKSKDDDIYKVFFKKEVDGKERHLHVIWDSQGDKKSKSKQAHKGHHVHN